MEELFKDAEKQTIAGRLRKKTRIKYYQVNGKFTISISPP